MNSEPSNPNVIRITAEEANSEHVDDLLKRQMSLRGEPGVTREHGRHWYLQNWFIFGVAGMLAAIVAWAIIEPFFADALYIQGKIERVTPTSFTEAGIDGRTMEEVSGESGYVRINGQDIWVVRKTTFESADGSWRRVRFSDLEQGQSVGIFVRHHVSADEDVWVALHLTPVLKTQSAREAAMTLRQLSTRAQVASNLLFPIVAGLIGLAIGGVDGFVCRLPRRALLSGLIGLLVGLIGGFISHLAAGIVYAPVHYFATKQLATGSLGPLGFMIQIAGRSVAWGFAGMAMGLGQGIALRSKQLLLYGFIGGAVGGLLGGMFFDPIDFLLVPDRGFDASLSRAISLAIVGLCVGALIGVVELIARDAWLRMTQGPLAGKEFLLFKDVMKIGSSARSDIYLFNDPLVAEKHATLRAIGDEAEIQSEVQNNRVLLNGRPVREGRLRHGDQVTIGRTVFVFEKRKR